MQWIAAQKGNEKMREIILLLVLSWSSLKRLQTIVAIAAWPTSMGHFCPGPYWSTFCPPHSHKICCTIFKFKEARWKIIGFYVFIIKSILLQHILSLQLIFKSLLFPSNLFTDVETLHNNQLIMGILHKETGSAELFST